MNAMIKSIFRNRANLINNIIKLDSEYRLKKEISIFTYSHLKQICKEHNIRSNIKKSEMECIVFYLKNNVRIPREYYLDEKIIPNNNMNNNTKNNKL